MPLPNAVRPCCVCVQVRPTDSQYRDYKRSEDSLWSNLEPVKLDTAKLEHLFETKSKEIPVTKVAVSLFMYFSHLLWSPSTTLCM